MYWIKKLGRQSNSRNKSNTLWELVMMLIMIVYCYKQLCMDGTAESVILTDPSGVFSLHSFPTVPLRQSVSPISRSSLYKAPLTT